LSSKSLKQKLHSTIEASSIAQTKSFHLLLFEKMQKKKKKKKGKGCDRQTDLGFRRPLDEGPYTW
jgi:hypothetical protein